jgi:trigger factor
VEAVADLVDIPLPNALVHAEEHFRLDRLTQQAQSYGMQLDTYAQALGTTAPELVEQQRAESRSTVKAQLVVDAIGRELGITVGQDDLGEEIARQAARLGRPPQELAELMTSSQERVAALVTDAFRRKTIDAINERVTITGGPPADDADLATEAPEPEAAEPAEVPAP